MENRDMDLIPGKAKLSDSDLESVSGGQISTVSEIYEASEDDFEELNRSVCGRGIAIHLARNMELYGGDKRKALAETMKKYGRPLGITDDT